MQLANKLMMFSMSVRDMSKSRAFYADQLGLKIVTDYRQDDDNWWVTLSFPEGGANITLGRAKSSFPASAEGLKPGTLSIYFSTSDVAAAHAELSNKGVQVNPILDDLFGPGSGVKWFNLNDPDGNSVFFVQA